MPSTALLCGTIRHCAVQDGSRTGKTEGNPRGGWELTDSPEQAINFVVFA